MLKRDDIKLGIILGLLAPIVGVFGYYFAKFRLFSLQDFFRVLRMQPSLLTGIVSIALILNAVIFTLYINKHKDKTARGIFLVTCVYALAALFVKWFA